MHGRSGQEEPKQGTDSCSPKMFGKGSLVNTPGMLWPHPHLPSLVGVAGAPQSCTKSTGGQHGASSRNAPSPALPQGPGLTISCPSSSRPFNPQAFCSPKGGALSGQLWTQGDFSPPPSFPPALSAGEAAQPSSYMPKLATTDKGLRASAKSEKGSKRGPGGTKLAPTQSSPCLYQ